ncbi:MAG: translation elongation factor Ts [Armatimonadota bacterium]
MDISAEDVKDLREKTGAGVMDCKAALMECDGDFEAAIDYLRQKGIEVAQKRDSKTAAEGIIEAYIHGGGKIGVIVEINCETDFAARSEDFEEFARDIAMQIAAMSPRWVSAEDVPENAKDREREVLTRQAKEEGKPDHIVEKMVEGRMRKFYENNCLLNQPYIRDDSITVEEYLNEVMGKLGERMVIRRFTRYQVGEETE